MVFHRAMRSVLAAGILAATSAGAGAFNCAPTEYAPCQLDLGAVTVYFPDGIANFDGESQFNGSDGYVVGPDIGTNAFPNLNAIDTATEAGFWFDPGLLGVVGGSGFEGEHEALAAVWFDGLRFEVNPGWRIDSLTMTVTGQRTLVGNAQLYLVLPGPAVYSGDSFAASGTVPLGPAFYSAGFSLSTIYEEGEDGTAAQYGTGQVRFDRITFLAQVSAVPEPRTTALWLSGALMLAAAAKRR